MIHFYICCGERQDTVLLAGTVVRLLRQYGEDAQPICVSEPETLLTCLTTAEAAETTEILTCDICVKNAISVLEQLRRKSQDMKLIVLADGTISPTAYIRPAILPTSLLWRPVTKQEAERVVGEVLAMGLSQNRADEGDCAFQVEVRGTIKRYSYREILYFEAREKKLWLHLGHKELSFPGTLEKLQEELPDNFMRIHKSFIINRHHAVEVQYGQNVIQLSDGTALPISRTYKTEVKAVFS
jgi:hypothetical protein